MDTDKTTSFQSRIKISKFSSLYKYIVMALISETGLFRQNSTTIVVIVEV